MPCTNDNSNDNATPSGYVLSDMPRYPPSDSSALSGPPPPVHPIFGRGPNLNIIQLPGPPPALPAPPKTPFAFNPGAPAFEPPSVSNKERLGLRIKAENKARKSCKHKKDECRLFWSHTTEDCDMRWVKTKARNARKAGIMPVMKEKAAEAEKGDYKLAEVRDKKNE
jgi:hypothetical protein